MSNTVHGPWQRMTTAMVAAIITVALVAGCSDSSSSKPPQSSPATAASTTPNTVAPTSSPPVDESTVAATTDPPTDDGAVETFATAVSTRLDDDGTIGLPLALDLFATYYGHADELGATPLPAVRDSATMALAALESHRAELTPAQAAVLDEVESFPAADVVEIGGPGDAGPTGSFGSLRRLDADLEAIARQANNEIASHWPGPLTQVIRIETIDPLPAGVDADTLADALPVDAAGRPAADPTVYTTCRVRVFRTDLSAQDELATIAHEIFHCYQDTIVVGRIPMWIREGQAEWVGAAVAGGGSVATEWWGDWINGSSALWLRTYDAIGFYASVQRHTGDAWAVLPAMLSGPTTDPLGEFAIATGGGGTPFLGEIAIDHAALASFGARWTPVGPGAPALGAPGAHAIGTGETYSRAASLEGYDASRLSVHVADPVLEITVSTGTWAFGNSNVAQVVDGGGTRSLCLLAECRCPDGRLLDTVPMGADPSVAFAIANGTLAALEIEVAFRGVPIDQACSEHPAPVAACLVGSWQLTGQKFADAFLPAISAAGILGGIGGRHLDVAANGAYVMTDDGSDPVISDTDLGGGLTTQTVVTITGRVDGMVTSDATAALFSSTTASVDLHGQTTVSGAPPVSFDQHYDDASLFGNGEATVTCDAGTLTLGFENVTFTYAREG